MTEGKISAAQQATILYMCALFEGATLAGAGPVGGGSLAGAWKGIAMAGAATWAVCMASTRCIGKKAPVGRGTGAALAGYFFLCFGFTAMRAAGLLHAFLQAENNMATIWLFCAAGGYGLYMGKEALARTALPVFLFGAAFVCLCLSIALPLCFGGNVYTAGQSHGGMMSFFSCCTPGTVLALALCRQDGAVPGWRQAVLLTYGGAAVVILWGVLAMGGRFFLDNAPLRHLFQQGRPWGGLRPDAFCAGALAMCAIGELAVFGLGAAGALGVKRQSKQQKHNAAKGQKTDALLWLSAAIALAGAALAGLLRLLPGVFATWPVIMPAVLILLLAGGRKTNAAAKAALPVILAVLLCGCGGSVLPDTAVVDVISVWKQDNGWKVEVAYNAPDSDEPQTYTGAGDTLSAAYAHALTHFRRPPYLGHIRAVVLCGRQMGTMGAQTAGFFLSLSGMPSGAALLVLDDGLIPAECMEKLTDLAASSEKAGLLTPFTRIGGDGSYFLPIVPADETTAALLVGPSEVHPVNDELFVHLLAISGRRGPLTGTAKADGEDVSYRITGLSASYAFEKKNDRVRATITLHGRLEELIYANNGMTSILPLQEESRAIKAKLEKNLAQIFTEEANTVMETMGDGLGLYGHMAAWCYKEAQAAFADGAYKEMDLVVTIRLR